MSLAEENQKVTDCFARFENQTHWQFVNDAMTQNFGIRLWNFRRIKTLRLSSRNWACWERKDNFPENSSKTDGLNWQLRKRKRKHIWLLFPPSILLVSLAGLEGHLQDFIPQTVPVQAVDCHGGLLVVWHGDEAKAFALVGVEISDHFHVDNGAEWPEHLPQDCLVCVLTQIIDEDAPTTGRVPRDSASTAHVVNAHWRKPRNKQEVQWKMLSSQSDSSISVIWLLWSRSHVFCYLKTTLTVKIWWSIKSLHGQ